MIIRCPKCRTAYSVQNDQIYEAGRQVRCSQCQHIWHQIPVFEAFKAEKLTKVAPLAPENLTGNPASEIKSLRLLSQKYKSLKIALLSGFLALTFILSILFLAQNFFEEMFPASKGFYSLIGLESEASEKTTSATGLVIPKDEVERTLEDGEPMVLTFKGFVRNTNSVSVTIPKIIITLHDDKGVEIDRWPAYPEKSRLNPGEEAKWTCRFFNPDLDSVFEHRIQFR
jgi:predicted Zn finger-like uncharacterized protein